jgi:hypothetical protein
MNQPQTFDFVRLIINKKQRPWFWNGSQFHVMQHWDKRIIYAREFDSAEFKQLIHNPDTFMQSGQCLKNGDSTTVTRVQLAAEQLVIKRYNIINHWHAVRRAFRPSRAAHCWHNAHVLNHYQLHTPNPVAMIEYRWGLIRRKAYYVMRFEPGESGLSTISNACIEQRERLLIDLQNDMQTMYTHNISHGDLKANNLLWTDQWGWSWLDLDGMRQYRFRFRFLKAWRKDMRRWLKNWQGQPQIEQHIKHIFKWI